MQPDFFKNKKVAVTLSLVTLLSIVTMLLIFKLFWILLKETPLDVYGHYYENVFGVYVDDKNSHGFSIFNNANRLEGASKNNFEVIHIEADVDADGGYVTKYAYAKSDDLVYFNNQRIVGANAESFEHVGGFYAVDYKKVYFRESPVDFIDRDSFSYLGNSVLKDNSGVYLFAIPVVKEIKRNLYEPLDPRKTKILKNENGSLYFDEAGVYYRILEPKKAIKKEDGTYLIVDYGSGETIYIYTTEKTTLFNRTIFY